MAKAATLLGIVLLALCGGFMGGFMESRMFPDKVDLLMNDGPVSSSDGFHLYDSQGAQRASLAVDELGNPYLTFFREDSTIGLSIWLDEDSTPSVWLFDSNNTIRAGLFLHEDGTPFITLADKEGTLLGGMLVDEDGSICVESWDQSENRHNHISLIKAISIHF